MHAAAAALTVPCRNAIGDAQPCFLSCAAAVSPFDCRLSLVTCCLLRVASHLLFVVHCSLFVVCHLSFVVCHCRVLAWCDCGTNHPPPSSVTRYRRRLSYLVQDLQNLSTVCSAGYCIFLVELWIEGTCFVCSPRTARSTPVPVQHE